jgi:acyl-CoA thioester hydrolase
MSKVTRWHFQTRSYEVGPNEQVHPHIYSNYFEIAAWTATAEQGYPYEWYKEHQRTWVMRKLTLRYFDLATLGDNLWIDTWIQESGRLVTCFRHYDMRRHDNAPIARAVADWVYMNTITMRPERIPEEFMSKFEPSSEAENLDTEVSDPIAIEEAVVHTEERRVQRHEIDSVGHTNNAIYLAWVEQAIISALRAAGWPPERYAPDGEVVVKPIAHTIEYSRSAFENEPIWVVTRLAQVGRDRAAWLTEIRHSATGELLAKDVAVKAFTDDKGPRSIPDSLQLALTKRVRE